MKYELGDRVRIKKHWKRKGLYDGLPFLGKSLEEYLTSDEMAGSSYKFNKYLKGPLYEVGLIVGVRTIKVSADFMWDEEHEVDYGEFGTQVYKARINQTEASYEKNYLVASGMNCLRRVSFEDIQYIGNEDEQ